MSLRLSKKPTEAMKKMDNPEKIALYIADSEAKKFLLFQEHYDTFSLLAEKEVFTQRNAVVSLFFDHNSVLQTIKRSDYLFARKFDTIPNFD